MEITVEKLQALENDQEFLAKMNAAETDEEVQAVLKSYGIEMAAGDENGELSEDALDNVAGGGWLSNWFKKWFKKQSKKNADDINKLLRGM